MISSVYLRTPSRLLALFIVLGGLPLAEVNVGLQSMLDLLNNLDPAAIEA